MDIHDGMSALSNSSVSGLPSGEHSAARIRRPSRGKPGGESAKNLLGSLLDESAAAAEEERLRREEDRMRADEEARLAKEHEEEMARLEAERAIIAEKQAQEEMRLHQVEMQAQVQREKDIEAGLIDLEEEARKAREEEERKRAEAEAKAKKEAGKRAAEELKRQQEAELAALRQEEVAKNAAPKKNHFVLPMVLVALVLLAMGAGYFVMEVKPHNERMARLERGYSLQDEYITKEVKFETPEAEMLGGELMVVKQAADPKPVVKRPSSGKKPATTTTPASPSGGKLGGGKLGGGKLGGGKLGGTKGGLM